MATRDSTSLRLAPKEKALIAKAAATLGDDLGAFIRNAARARAEQVLADVEYRHYMEQTAKAAFEERNEPALTTAQVRQRLALRRKK